jgi:NADPH:quinone reductase-like Zn-dependent oxidoreductase
MAALPGAVVSARAVPGSAAAGPVQGATASFLNAPVSQADALAGGTQQVKAVVCMRYGPPEVLRLQDVAKPVPGRKQVCIRVVATAVTSSDCYIRGLNLPLAYRMLARLALGLTAPRRPILGMVLAGEVESAGPDVRAFSEGDQVFGLDRHRFGTYAEYVCWPGGGVLAPLPAGLTYQEAAAVPYGGLLALHYLRAANLRSGQRVVIYGASGAVGTSAVQLARHFGATVTGVCGPANLGLVKSLGAATVVDYTRQDFATRGERYDIIFDAVGKRKSGTALRDTGKALAPGGRRLSVDDGTPKLRASDLAVIRALAGAGQLRPVIDRCYPLEQIVKAHRYVDGGHKRGNVIVTVGPEA